MHKIKQYDIFILSKDLNPNITRGMKGVILELYSESDIVVEFVKEDGSNYEFEGNFIFTIDTSYIEKLVGK